MIDGSDLAFLQREFDFWERLTPQQQDFLQQNLYPIHYDAGDIIHNGAYSCIGVLFIKKGGLRVFMLSDEGKEITLYRLGPRDVCLLSASCILQNITFNVCIETESETEVLLIPASRFQSLVSENMCIENEVYKLIVDRFSSIMWAMEQMLFMKFDKRLAIFLLDELSKTGNPKISLTHEQIAKYMGSAREVVSRMLKHFSNEGMVELSRGGILITNKEKLRKLTI